VALDHANACAHHAGELEHGDTGGERVRRERRAQVVDPDGCRDAGALDGGRPFAPPEVVEVEELAGRRREQQRRRELGGQPVERGDGAAGERNIADRVGGLAARPDRAVGGDLLDPDDTAGAVDMPALERGPLLRSQPGRGSTVAPVIACFAGIPSDRREMARSGRLLDPPTGPLRRGERKRPVPARAHGQRGLGRRAQIR
jgi:hypothetical protein